MINTIKTKIPIVLFFVLLIVAYLSYTLGLPSVFILDDQPNLSPMKLYPQFSYWDRFWLFILEGTSGPTGRPISLASFFFNDSNWPSAPEKFIFTNIYIHIINGILVFWFTFKLGPLLSFKNNQKSLFSLVATSLWLLHPLNTSTVLYIIQRMTELSALFTLTGLLFYLYGRNILETHKLKGFLLLFVGVGLSLLFSILSKENGILLVAFILVLEFFLLQPFKQKPPGYFYYWLTPAVILPFLAVFIYLGIKTDPNSFGNRNFTLTERLLTEPRILFDYIYQIFIPKVNNSGIFHDDYIVSKSLFDPITTLPSIIGIASLFTAMWLLRKKAPLIAFAIAWFFAGHIIESTTLSLELYFEHRNYLPMLGFLIAITYYLSQFFIKQQKIVITATSISLVLLVFLLLQSTKQWSNPAQLVINAYHAHPQSKRAKEAYFLVMRHLGVPEKKLLRVKQLSNQEKTPYSAFQELTQACQAKQLTGEMLDSTFQVIIDKPVHGATSVALISFVENCIKKPSYATAINDIERFLINMLQLKKVKNGDSHFHHNVNLLLSEITKMKGDFKLTMSYLKRAYEVYPEYELLKRRAGYFTSTGLHQKALDVLNDTSQLETGIRQKLAMQIKKQELNKMKKNIRIAMLEKQNIAAKK